MKKTFGEKLLSVITSLSIILQSLSPFLAVIPSSVKASEPITSNLKFDLTKNTFSLEVTTGETVNYVLSYKTDTSVEGVHDSGKADSGPLFTRDIEAKTCSADGECILQTVIRGILKTKVESVNYLNEIRFAIDDGKLIEISNGAVSTFDFTDADNYWIEHGTDSTVTPTVTPSPTPAGEILDGISTSVTPTPTVDVLGEGTGNEQVTAAVVESNSCQVNSLNGCLNTDKPDYAPTEMVVITGTGFLPNSLYYLWITSNNLSVLYIITTDEVGAFTYSYQLDGTYRPNYTVELKDGSGTVVATVTFTDAPVSGCVNDSAGANDQPGQKDLTKMCVDYSGLPTSILVDWNWDEISGSGNNSYDSCSLFDTDSDGLANYSICVTLKGDPLAQTTNSPRIYTCNDTKADRCAGAALVVGSYATSCSVSQQATDPFPAGDVYPQDTVATCNIAMSEVGGATSALIDDCSFPSQEPNSAPSDCIVFKVNTGRLEVVKDLIPGTDAGLFNLQIGGTTEAANVGDGGTTGEKVLSTANNGTVYTVGETAGTSTSLSNYSTSIVCKDLNGTGSTVAQSSDAGPLNVTLNENDDVVCTITNTRQSGSIELKKAWSGTAGQTTLNIGTSAGGTQVDSQLTGASGAAPLTTGANTVDTGTYYVSESGGLTDYTTSALSCFNDINNNGVNNSEPSVTVNANDSVTVATGQHVICTFTNTRNRGTIELKKVWSGTGGRTTLNIGSSAGGTQVDSQLTGASGAAPLTTGTNTVNTGTYYVSETGGLTNYSSSLACTDNGTPVTPGASNSLSVTTGHAVICTFTNTRNRGTIELKKVWSGTGGQTTLNIGTSNGGSQVDTQLTGLAGASPLTTDQNTVNTGTYYMSETGGLTDYTTSALSCFNDINNNGVNNSEPSVTVNANDSVTIATGQHVICTYTNTRKTGTLLLHKQYDSDGNGSYDIVNDSTANTTGFRWGLSSTPANNTNSFGGSGITLDLASYNVYENTVANYHSTGYFRNANVGEGASCSNPDGSSLPALIDVFQDTTTEITICNARDTGSIELKKAWSGTGGRTTLNIGSSAGGTQVDSQLTGASGAAPLTTGANTVNTGTYYVSETGGLTNYSSSLACTDNGDAVTPGANNSLLVASGHTVICTYTNTRNTGTITVNKEVDTDGDGTFEGGNTVANTLGFVWGLDSETPARSMGSTVADLETGNYNVDENSVTDYHFAGWYDNDGDGNCESPDDTTLPVAVNVTKDQISEITLCNARDTGALRVYKNIDGNNDGDLDDPEDETNVAGWTWDIDGGEQNITMGNNRTLTTGNYTITEDEKPDDFAFVSWSCNNDTSGTTNSLSLALSKDEKVTCQFVNTPLADIHGQKWNDINGDGVKDQNEEYLSGWKIFIDENDNQTWDDGEKSMLTDSGAELGWYWFLNLTPGTYSICEEPQAGWIQTSTPICHTVELPNGENTCTPSEADNRSDTATFTCDFANKFVPPELEISKSNDAAAEEAPGGNVTFSLTVKAKKNTAFNVVVTDLTAGGFVYRSGSWSATKNGLPFSIAEPVYNSPGKWYLGNLNPDDVVILTYIADISSSIPLGLYPDNAWAFGCDESDPECSVADSTAVLAAAVDPGQLTTNFVGTQVNVNAETSASLGINIKKEEKQEVLGASTSLPATGASTIWMILGSMLLIVGTLFVIIGLLMKKAKGGVFKSLGILVAFLLFSSVMLGRNVYAADILNIRLEQPKSPTSQNTFNINFVTLDILDRSITVKCFKKGPSDGAYSQFGADIAITAGGNNNGNCAVNSSVITADGTYLFYATATAGSDTATSETDSVDFNITSGPGTPTSYTKDQLDSCNYRIKFRTANDAGKTVKVEIYRSSETEFNADAGTRITSINVGSDEEKTFTDTIPVCNKTYYYVIRAFDSAGNGSGLIGDSVVTVTTTTIGGTTTTQQTSVGAGGESGSILGTTTGGAIPVTNVTLPAPSGEVKGESTPSAVPVVEANPLGGIKGVFDNIVKKENRPWLVLLAVIVVGIVGYVIYKKSQNSEK